MLNKENQKIVRKLIKDQFGHSNLSEVRKYLKSKAKYQYGCYYYEEKIKGGVTLSYTSNDNCFASTLVSLKLVGMTSQYALAKQDLTKSGIQRGCSSHYIFK